jgi:uncharacterized membrane protein (UPF0127 family)
MVATFRRLAALVALVLVAGTVCAQQPQLPEVELAAGVHLIHAELANDFASRMQGLMYRTALPPNGGMLFVFEAAAVQCMWMKNTLIPLSVAFIGSDGKIVNIADMQPQTEDAHCAAQPARYALEMEQGWFAQRGIRPGMQLRGFDKLPR